MLPGSASATIKPGVRIQESAGPIRRTGGQVYVGANRPEPRRRL